MIIERIDYENERVTIITNEKTKSFKAKFPFNKSELENITNIEIESLEDFKELKIKKKEDLNRLQKGILKTTDSAWKIFNKKSRQLPRPLGTIVKNETTEFLTVSFNSKSVTKSQWANEKIVEYVNKKLSKSLFTEKKVIETKSEDSVVLNLIQEGIKNILNKIDFEIRIGIKCLTPKENIEKMIKTYNLCYVEEPFKDLKQFKKLRENVQHMCFICSSNKTILNKGGCNAFLIKNESIEKIKKLSKKLKKDKITPILLAEDSLSSHLASGLMIPIIKLETFNDKTKEYLDELDKIESQMKNS